MGKYVFDADSPVLNAVFLKDAPGPMVSPEIAIAQDSKRAARSLNEIKNIQLASLHGQRLSLDAQRDTAAGVRQLHSGVERVGERMSQGLERVSQGVAHGMQQVGSQVGRLAEGVETGFAQLDEGMAAGFRQLDGSVQTGFQDLALGMQSGFGAVVTGLYHVDRRLGKRIVAGFRMLGGQMAEQHGQLLGALDVGFDRMGGAVAQAGARVADAVALGAQAQVAATQESTRALLHGQALQTQVLAQALATLGTQMGAKLDEVNHNLRHRAANEAREHFVVGMRYLNGMDFAGAREQFSRARGVYAGHFPTLFAEGFCARVLGRAEEAESLFAAARSQTDEDPEVATRQAAVAELYLGRLAFERGDYAEARTWLGQAHTRDRALLSALVEEAASLLADPERSPRRAEDALVVAAAFNRQGADAVRCWYALALTLAGLAPEVAREAFKKGATVDPAASRRDRGAVLATLWHLNARTTEALVKVLAREFPWLV